MVKKSRLISAVVTLGVVAGATPLFAAPADMIRGRVSGYRELGAAFKAVNDALRAPTPQTMLIQISARQIANASRAQYSWFPAGSGPETGQKTAARPDIWSQAARFKQAQDSFASEAAAFQRVAQGGNIDQIRAASRKLGGTCKSCHESFRNEVH